MIKPVNQSQLQRMLTNMFAGPGDTPLESRKAIRRKVREYVQTGKSAPLNEPTLEAYVEKIARHAYTITEDDMQHLHQAGYTEPQIFELTTAAALAAGATRLEIVTELLQTIEK